MDTSWQKSYQDYQNSSRGKTVADMYDQQTQAQIDSLTSAYEQNLSDANAARSNIDTQYRSNANNLASQYERQRRNNNIQAAANGLNTGTASQVQLAQSASHQRDYGNLMGQYGHDVAESERGIANLKATYQNAIKQAQAEGDYKKMAALLDDYNTQYNNMLQQASTLAQYGDFSGYKALGYTDQQIAAMRSSWIAQNPLLAYNTGAITAEQYYKMTGKYAPGHAPAATGGGGGRGRGRGSYGNQTVDTGGTGGAPVTQPPAVTETPAVRGPEKRTGGTGRR